MKFGILSDAHGHVGAFDVAVAALRAAGAEFLFFLGDAVGYIPEASVVGRIRALGITAIKGNHEIMMLSQNYAAEREPIYQLQATWAQLDESTQAFLGGLESERMATLDGTLCLFVHGSPIDPSHGYVYPDTDLSAFAGVAADAVFMGHTHRPFVQTAGGKVFVNVGSCGLPRDGDGRGAAGVFDTVARRAEIIRFDISAASRAALTRYALHASVAAALERSIVAASHA